ncbi:hypothetical protein BIU98_08345 [Curtobacterium sp. MMLR14_010]|uniref:hypothetical protein n=1 Tax=Curtobacterium sp. MMLR14_010 TaxID=1898743 RepID=UPI0008DDF650|nr:hypothetical protein [Curtobacterium sp. MMLR14_010]OII31748.1 hypothetical protein BIU98_08345 [Curtobacterium sp. MMLR14_010]
MHKTLAAVAALAAVTLTLTGCSQLRQQTGDAWAVTYEVSVDAPDAGTLHDVRYLGAEQRGDAATTHTIPTASTRPGAADGGAATWTHESIVLAKDPASVRATPPAGQSASCRILLDGTKVIAEEHGAAGKTVRCRVETPAFK